jgi:glycosidase
VHALSDDHARRTLRLLRRRDPFSRAAFPWDDKRQWNEPLLAFYQRAGALRRDHPVLRTGNFNIIYAEADVFAFQRQLDGETAIVAFNRGLQEANVDLPLTSSAPGRPYRDVWNEQEVEAQGETLKSVCIPPRAGVVILNAADRLL